MLEVREICLEASALVGPDEDEIWALLGKTWFRTQSKSEAQPNAKQKRYVVLGCLHTVFSIVRHAIQPRRKERSSAMFPDALSIFRVTISIAD